MIHGKLTGREIVETLKAAVAMAEAALDTHASMGDNDRREQEGADGVF